MKKWLGVLMVLALVFLPIVAYCEQEFLPQQNKVGAVGKTGKAWRLGAYGTLQLPEITTPSTNPPTDNGWLYVLDGGGSVQTLYFKDVAGTVTNLLQAGTPALDKVGDPVANASITLGTYTNVFTGAAIAANQNQFINTGNMGDYAIIYIQQMTGTPTDGKLLYATTASEKVDGIQVYNSDSDIGSTSVLLRLDFADDDDTDGYFIVARDNAAADTEFSVDMVGNIVGTQITVASTVLDVNSLDFVGAGSITSGASTALTLNPAGGDAAGEDLIITAHNIALAATGALTISPDAALTTAIILTDTDLTNALSVGDNNIIGTTGGFTYTAWSIDASGNFVTTGTLSGATIAQDAIVAKSAATTLTLNGTGAGGVSIGTVSGTGAITLGGGGFATLVNLPSTVDLTLSGGELDITDTANTDLVDLVNNTLTTANVLHMSATGTRTSGAAILITDGATTANTVTITASTQTSGKGISYTNAGAGILTGDAIYLAVTDGAGFTGGYINCFDGAASDFTVKRYGATVIAGNASGTPALTLTAGDIAVTSGDLDLAEGMIVADTTGATKFSYIKMTTNTDVAADAALFTLSDTDTDAANAHFLLRLRHFANGDPQDNFIVVEDNNGATDLFTMSAGGTTAWLLDAASYVQIDGSTTLTTTTAGVLDINVSTLTTTASAIDVKVTNTGNAATITGIKIDLDDDTAGTGVFYGLSLGSSDSTPAAGANLSTGIGFLTGLDVAMDADLDAAGKLFDIDAAASYTGKMFDINLAAWLGTTNEGVIDIVSTAAATVPAGQIIRIRQLGTGQHAAAIAGTLIYLEDDAVAPAAGTSYVLNIDATNIEAIKVDTGKVLVDETLTATGGLSSGTASDSFIYTDTVELSNVNIKALRATPITLVAAPGAANFIEVISVVLILDYGTNVLTESADNLVVEYLSGIDITAAIETTGFIDQAADQMALILPSTIATMTAANALNDSVQLFNTGDGEFAGNAGNDTTMTVKISYRIHAAGL